MMKHSHSFLKYYIKHEARVFEMASQSAPNCKQKQKTTTTTKKKKTENKGTEERKPYIRM